MTTPGNPRGTTNLQFSDAGPTDVANFHRQSDVNSSPLAQHHTLGIQPNQASAGDHSHNGVDSVFLDPGSHTHTGYAATVHSHGSEIPTGSVTMYGGPTPPTGWLFCDGNAVSRTTYATLYGIIGITFGAGDGSTTFNVPDLRSKYPVGAGSAYSRNSQFGVNSVTLNTGQIPAHTHTLVSDGNHGHNLQGTLGGGTGQYAPYFIDNGSAGAISGANGSGSTPAGTLSNLVGGAGSHTHTVNSGGGTGGDHENRPPSVGIYFMIKT